MENKGNHGDIGHHQVAPIHSQVVKIKREFEKIQQPEMRRVLREIMGRQRSRSPLGLTERPISVGN